VRRGTDLSNARAACRHFALVGARLWAMGAAVGESISLAGSRNLCAATIMTASALYVGHIRHRRSRPHAHGFRYRIAQFYLDLDEVPQLFAKRWLWSTNRLNVAQFRRSDYLGEGLTDLKTAVQDCVQAATGLRPDGPIRLLTNLRYFGYVINPVSFYYCFASDGTTLLAIVAEITNTPWNERHRYVLPTARSHKTGAHGQVHQWEFDKDFHVSPFLPMMLRYDWRFAEPDRDLRVHMNVVDDEGALFDATLTLKRRELTGPALARFLVTYPLMTLSIVGRIYLNALLLALKRTRFHSHPALAPKKADPAVPSVQNLRSSSPDES